MLAFRVNKSLSFSFLSFQNISLAYFTSLACPHQSANLPNMWTSILIIKHAKWKWRLKKHIQKWKEKLVRYIALFSSKVKNMLISLWLHGFFVGLNVFISHSLHNFSASKCQKVHSFHPWCEATSWSTYLNFSIISCGSLLHIR